MVRMDILCKKFYNLILRIFGVIIIFLILAILCRSDYKYKEYIYNYIYNSDLGFYRFRDIYDRYFGGVFPIYMFNQEVEGVFNEQIDYTNFFDYYDGVKLEVSDNYLIPVINDGIVVYVGEKENYGNVIILEDENGINNWYGNVCNSSVSLYDSLSSGTYIGESCDNYIYLVFSNGKQFLNYRLYLNY